VSAADDLTLAQLRAELRHLVALADTAERPKPDVINPAGHGMAGHEWRLAQDVAPGVRPPMWVVRTVDDPETRDGVYVAQPDPYLTYDWEPQLDFAAMSPLDARRLAMALLGVTRLEDRRAATKVTP
jgi:hypothetical protein